MIWGKTHEQNTKSEDGYWFAWRPVWLVDGRTAWLQTVFYHKCWGYDGPEIYYHEKDPLG